MREVPAECAVKALVNAALAEEDKAASARAVLRRPGWGIRKRGGGGFSRRLASPTLAASS